MYDCGCVPITERGFRYGDGVFVTVARRGARLLDLDAHLERLESACELTGLRMPDELGDAPGLANIVAGLIGTGAAVADGADADTADADTADADGATGADGGVVRIQVSAGVSGRGYGREENSGWGLVELLPMPLARPLRITIQEADTDLPLPSLPGVKTCSALPLVLLAREAQRLGCHEVIRVHKGLITEAGSANAFWWSDETLHTPGESGALYAGVTRGVVLAAAADTGLQVHRESAEPASLRDAEAVFLTNAVRGMERAHRLGDRPLEWPDALEELSLAVESRRLAGSTAVRSGDETCLS